MTTTSNGGKEEAGFPVDLGSWLPERDLMELVLAAGSTVEWRQEPPVRGVRPQVLLSLLTYAYARGMYASSEVERRCRQDNGLQYLTAHAQVEAEALYRFRRCYRDRLGRALALVLQSFERQHVPWKRSGSRPDRSGWSEPALSRCTSVSSACEREAEERIRSAMRADSAALDI